LRFGVIFGESMREIDIINIGVGQKAVITFDAFESESFLGEVAEVDVLGEVEQGVVSYKAKIIFDTENKLIKTGMTANVEIIIYENKEALTIPLSSVKTFKNNSFVEVLDSEGKLERKSIIVGKSNDTIIEVLEGLVEGDSIVISTQNSAAKTTNKTNSGLMNGMPGMGTQQVIMR